jgi:amino acid transporter
VYELALTLLIVGIGFNAYRRARREGVWSWREFAITLAGIALVLMVVITWELFLMKLGPDHALAVTVLTVIPIIMGVTMLARYLSKRRKLRR